MVFCLDGGGENKHLPKLIEPDAKNVTVTTFKLLLYQKETGGGKTKLGNTLNLPDVPGVQPVQGAGRG